MKAVKDETLNFKHLKSWPALLFVRAYKALINVLYKPTPPSPKLSLLPSHAVYTPPNQTTIPPNPNFSKESNLSAASSSSAASKAEHFTERFADAFIEASFESILDELGRGIPWLDPSRGYRLSFRSISFIIL